MIRAFIAAPLPDPMVERLARGAAEARRGLDGGRWTPPDRWHLTLTFLGDIPAGTAERIGAGLGRIAALRPVPVRPAGTGGFPTRGGATVLWAGVEGDPGLRELAAVAAEIATGGGARAPEGRLFVPHITIARFRRARDLAAIDLWGGSGETDGEACLLSRVVLLESRLSPAGPSYTALRDVALAGGELQGA